MKHSDSGQKRIKAFLCLSGNKKHKSADDSVQWRD